MAVNWGAPGPQNNALAYFQLGSQIGGNIAAKREEAAGRNALATYATDPNNQDAFKTAVQHDPRTAFAIRGDQREQQNAQREQQMNALPITLKMLKAATPENWQGLRQQAIQLGIPGADQAPEQYDPNWVGSQISQITPFATPQGQEILSTAGKVAHDNGLQPGTPEYRDFVMKYTQAQMAKPYTGSQGETRLYQPDFGGQQPQQQRATVSQEKPVGMTDDEIWTQAHEAVRNGANVEDVFRQLQAWGMQP